MLSAGTGAEPSLDFKVSRSDACWQLRRSHATAVMNLFKISSWTDFDDGEESATSIVDNISFNRTSFVVP
ncbi:hypothetical protein Tco_0090859 [Tanacetum coccineum]